MAPPVNDAFASASTLTGASGTTGAVTITEATTQASEPFDPDVKQTVWYTWTAPATAAVRFYCDPAIGAGRFASIAAFTGASIGTLVNVGIDSPPDGPERAAFLLTTTASTVYKFQLGVFFTPTITGSITMRWETVAPPANDNFANAVTLSGLSDSATPGDCAGATLQGSEPNGIGQTIWYTWVAPASGQTIIDLAGSVGSNDGSFDEWLVNVYTGSAIGSLTPVASGDLLEETPSFRFTAVEGTTYRIQVGTFGGNPVATPVVAIQQGPAQGVCVAFSDTALASAPFWTRLD